MRILGPLRRIWHAPQYGSPSSLQRVLSNRSRWRASFALALLALSACVAFYALLIADAYLCLESVFLGFVPYIFWSAYRQSSEIDFFAPNVGFPLAYIGFLFLGSISLPVNTEFGLTLPWVIWLYYIVGLISYLFGAAIFSSKRKLCVPKIFWSRKSFLLLTLIVFAIGSAARGIDIAKNGLPILNAQDEALRVQGARGILGVFSLCLEAGVECLLIFLLVNKTSSKLRILIASALLVAVVNAIASTNRNELMRMVFAAVVIIHYTKHRFKIGSIAALFVFGVVFVSVLGSFRDVSVWGDAHIRSLEQQGYTSNTYWLWSGYNVVRLPTETFYMAIQEVPEISPYTYGKTSFASFAEILPGHRPGPSEIVKNTLRLQFVGFGAAATILAPLWIDGGVLGIVLGMFLFGAISSALYLRVRLSSSYVWILVYAWFVQNAFKAIKDDIFPELGFAFVIVLFVTISFFSGPTYAMGEHVA